MHLYSYHDFHLDHRLHAFVTLQQPTTRQPTTEAKKRNPVGSVALWTADAIGPRPPAPEATREPLGRHAGSLPTARAARVRFN